MNGRGGAPIPVRDERAAVSVIDRRVLHRGFRTYERISFEEAHPGSARVEKVERELLLVGPVAAVLPYDPVRDEIVLFRQFRIGAHEATGFGDIVEVVAGLGEAGESPETTARRETMEEIGLEPLELLPMFDFCPSPGVCDEHGTLFCARVDASALPETAGVAGEHESTRPFAVPAEQALGLARSPKGLRNGYTLLALFWFALHHEEVKARWTG